MESIEILSQTPVIILDYNGVIPHGQIVESDPVPLVGRFVLTGMVMSDKNLTLTIKQGCGDTKGTIVYQNNPQVFPILAGVDFLIETRLFGKFVDIILENDSPTDNANANSFFTARGI